MDNDLNNVSHSRFKVSDEIDIVELLFKIWRRKWFIVTFMIIVTASTFLIVQFSHTPSKTYTVKTSLRIGMVGTYLIQSPEMIINTAKAELYTKARQQGAQINDITTTSIDNPRNTNNLTATILNSSGRLLLKLNALERRKKLFHCKENKILYLSL